MAELSEISGIDPISAKLLDMAGIRDAKQLAAQTPAKFLDKLNKANEMFSITEDLPSKAIISKWINSARKLVGHKKKKPKAASLSMAVNYEANEQVAEMLASAPCAIPLPGRFLMEQKLHVGDIPAGLLLNRYSGDLDVRIGNPEFTEADVPDRRGVNAKEVGSKPQPLNFDVSQLRKISSGTSSENRIPASKDGHEGDRVALIRAPREATNRGKNPNSRRYVRGVLHTHPWSLKAGAVISLLLILVFPLSLISASLLLLSSEFPEAFPWVPKWILTFPIALPVVGMLYVIYGLSGKCRICSQKLFVHKGALKHIKAHRILGLGYVVPLCIHLLLFSWFRCSSCGTPVRLKK